MFSIGNNHGKYCMKLGAHLQVPGWPNSGGRCAENWTSFPRVFHPSRNMKMVFYRSSTVHVGIFPNVLLLGGMGTRVLRDQSLFMIGGTPEENNMLRKIFFAAHSAHGQKISRPTLASHDNFSMPTLNEYNDQLS